MHEGDFSSPRFTGFKVLEVVDAGEFFSGLREHIRECGTCNRRYFQYLERVRERRTLQETDREYLRVIYGRY